LFAQLKKILESENTKKLNEKKEEMHNLPMSAGTQPIQFLSGTGHMGRPVMFNPQKHHQVYTQILQN